jgi:hypothetical protein
MLLPVRSPAWRRARQVADDGQRTGDQEDPEHGQRQFRAEQFGFGFFRDHVVRAAHEAEQQPHDQQVGVDHAGHVEREWRGTGSRRSRTAGQDQAEQDLTDKQADCRDEVGFCNRL